MVDVVYSKCRLGDERDSPFVVSYILCRCMTFVGDRVGACLQSLKILYEMDK